MNAGKLASGVKDTSEQATIEASTPSTRRRHAYDSVHSQKTSKQREHRHADGETRRRTDTDTITYTLLRGNNLNVAAVTP